MRVAFITLSLSQTDCNNICNLKLKTFQECPSDKPTVNLSLTQTLTDKSQLDHNTNTHIHIIYYYMQAIYIMLIHHCGEFSNQLYCTCHSCSQTFIVYCTMTLTTQHVQAPIDQSIVLKPHTHNRFQAIIVILRKQQAINQ